MRRSPAFSRATLTKGYTIPKRARSTDRRNFAKLVWSSSRQKRRRPLVTHQKLSCESICKEAKTCENIAPVPLASPGQDACPSIRRNGICSSTDARLIITYVRCANFESITGYRDRNGPHEERSRIKVCLSRLKHSG